MNEYPDSAWAILNTMEPPKKTSDKQLYYEYITFWVQAKEKNYEDITADTVIQDAAAYFLETNDTKKAAIALFYRGRIYYHKKQYKDAIHKYLQAEKLAKKDGNNYLLGTLYYDIGSIYSMQCNDEESMTHFELAQKHFIKDGKDKQANIVLNNMANQYIYMEPQQTEKAFSLYEQLLASASQKKDTMQMIVYLNNMAVASMTLADYDNAKKYIVASISLDKDSSSFVKSHAVLSEIYIKTNRPDSATILLNSLSALTDKMDHFELYNYYLLLHTMYSKKNDHQAALTHHEKALEVFTEIMDEQNKESILEIQKKYDHEKLQNEQNQIIIKSQRTKNVLLFISLITLVIIGALFISHARSKNKKRALEDKIEAVESLLESSQKEVSNLLSEDQRASEQLRKMMSEDQRASEQLRKFISQELDLVKKITAIRVAESENTKQSVRQVIEKLVYDKVESLLTWDTIYTLIDQFYPNARIELDKRMPNLSEKDKQLCYLTKAKFRGSEIAYILGCEYNTITTGKYRLRKKYKFKNKQDFDAFIESL